MEEYIVLDELLVKLSAILGASLLIERFLSLLSGAMSRLFLVRYSDQYTDLQKDKLLFEQDLRALNEDNALKKEDPGGAIDEDPEEVPYHVIGNNLENSQAKPKPKWSDLLRIRHISEILDDKERYLKYKENNVLIKDFYLQFLGAIIAIVACYVLEFSIWEFFGTAVNGTKPDPRAFDYLFTGIIIGSGTKPMNFLMNFILNRKIETDKDEIKTESESLEGTGKIQKSKAKPQAKLIAPAILGVQALSVEDLVGFEYDGGDRPGRLENTHRYDKDKDIDLIVYHHTCLHSDAPFQELVKEFDRKNWLAGYHCVVFMDGSIRVLCRWDRFGNHAKYFNQRSFGLAFQGNFETRPGIPSSNYDGSKGIIVPTEAQIDSAARVIAMYANLHQVPFNFPTSLPNPGAIKGIIPHNLIAKIACPGNNFPHEQFKKLIDTHYTSWKINAQAQQALDRFKNKPMTYHKN